ncbi:MAG: lipopolysaccharide biosynthesis protein, partial [Frankia sp.]
RPEMPGAVASPIIPILPAGPEPAAAAGAEAGEPGRRPMSMLYRNGLALVLNSGLSSLLGAGFWVVAARDASAEAVGVGTALVSALAAMAALSQMSIGGALTTFLPRAGAHQRRLVLYSYAGAIGLSFVLGGAFALVAPHISSSFAVLASVGATLGFTLAVTVWAVFALQDLVLTALRRAPWLPLENSLYSAAKFALLLALGSGTTALALFTVWVVPAGIAALCVSGLLFGKVLRRPGDETTDPVAGLGGAHEIQGFRRFLVGETVALIFEQIAVTLLPVFVVAGLGVEKGAEFGIAWMLVQALDQFPMNLGFSLTVEGAQPGADVRPMHAALRRRAVLALGALVVVAIIVAPLITKVFGGRYEHNSAIVLRLLLIGSLGRCVNSLALCAALAQRRVVPLIVIHGALAVLVPVLALTFGHLWGLAGVGIAWAMAQGVVAIGTFVVERWEIRRDGAALPAGGPVQRAS